MSREKLNVHGNAMDLIISMSEGNPGGMNVVMQLMRDPLGFIHVLNLDDMNIRGSQIWVGYKDFCDCDIEKFKIALKERSKEMVAMINEQCASYGEVAVTSGASFGR